MAQLESPKRRRHTRLPSIRGSLSLETATRCVSDAQHPHSAQMVLHTILACRIFFNLRDTARQEEAVMLSTSLSEFRAAPQGSNGFGNTEGVERQ